MRYTGKMSSVEQEQKDVLSKDSEILEQANNKINCKTPDKATHALDWGMSACFKCWNSVCQCAAHLLNKEINSYKYHPMYNRVCSECNGTAFDERDCTECMGLD